jgi:hypothetical protein
MIENNGIWVAGGTVTAGSMAAGTGAVATNTAEGGTALTVDDIRVMVRDLVEELTSHAALLPDLDQTVTVARLAEQESAKEAPDKSRLSALLQLVTAGAGSVSGVAGAVEAIERVVQSVL